MVRTTHLLAFILPVFIAAAYPTDALAVHLCWIEKVEQSDSKLRIFLVERYRGATSRIERFSSSGSESESKPTGIAEYFELQAGDVAHLRVGAHDWCTVTANVQGEALGVQIEAYSRPNGSPLNRASKFLVPGK